MAITGGYIKVKGIKVYYETNNGPEEKSTIVCLHTAGRESRQYHGMMELFDNKYNMIAFDMPAHGKSWPLPGNRAINEYHAYGDFIWEFITAMGIDNPILIGCSVGGNMVYYIAQHYPVKAIVSMQGADYTPHIDTSMSDLLNHPYCNVQYSHYDFSESLIGRDAPAEARDFILWGVCQEIGITKKADLGLYNDFDVRDGMKNITCPVLVIRGEDDWAVPEYECRGLMERLVGTKELMWKSVPGKGHFIAVEAPEVVCEAMEEFMANL